MDAMIVVIRRTLQQAVIQPRAARQALFLGLRPCQEAAAGIPGGSEVQHTDSAITFADREPRTALQGCLVRNFKDSRGECGRLRQYAVADTGEGLGLITLRVVDTREQIGGQDDPATAWRLICALLEDRMVS